MKATHARIRDGKDGTPKCYLRETIVSMFCKSHSCKGRTVHPPQHAVDGGHRRSRGPGADSLCDQPVSNLPGEHTWTLLFVVLNAFHHLSGSHSGSIASHSATSAMCS